MGIENQRTTAKKERVRGDESKVRKHSPEDAGIRPELIGRSAGLLLKQPEKVRAIPEPDTVSDLLNAQVRICELSFRVQDDPILDQFGNGAFQTLPAQRIEVIRREVHHPGILTGCLDLPVVRFNKIHQPPDLNNGGDLAWNNVVVIAQAVDANKQNIEKVSERLLSCRQTQG